MNILVKDIDLKIVSKYGNRIRNGKEEFHPGIDIRVVNELWQPMPIIAPEKIKIYETKFDKKWGHYFKAIPTEQNPLGICQFRFWHVKPVRECEVDKEFDEGEIIGWPESGYVPLHLHFETHLDYSGKNTIDPVLYLDFKNQNYII